MSDTKTTTTTETTGAPSILLTGATGFLGHHLLAAFDKKGVKVSALIRSPEGASRLPGKPV
ncbi:MAG TPA: NAD-dependent epimerase/dehydratase family protein, partial [Archangium sp.]